MSSFQQVWMYCSSRRFLARLLSTIICSILLVIQPFSKFGGPAAFLALTIKELVFSVQENLAQQLEATVLHFAGGITGLGLSILGKHLASLVKDDTTIACLIPAIFLIGISFLAGWLKSRLPRLTLSSRIACFVSIWLLTSDVGVKQQKIWPEAGYFLWIILTAASTSLLSSMLLLRWSSTQFACDVSSAFSELHSCLSCHLDTTLSELQPTTMNRNIHDALLKRSVTLNSVYQQAAFELRIGRLNVKKMKPFIGIIEHLRRELSWGMLFPRLSTLDSPVGSNIIRGLHPVALGLGNSILDSMNIIKKILLFCFERSIPPPCLHSEKEALLAAKLHLSAVMISAREAMGSLCSDWDVERTVSDSDTQLSSSSEVFSLCSFMISLLQMAHDTQHALDVTEDIIVTYGISHPRLWYPRFSLAWLGVIPTTIITEERGIFQLDEETPEPQSRLSQEEALRGIAEQAYANKPAVPNRVPSTKNKLTSNPFRIKYYVSLLRRAWTHAKVMRCRLLMSRLLRSTQHSPHLRHAFKNAIGIALLGIPAFSPQDSQGRQWFKAYFGQWMLISYVWVLETNTGATWRVAYLRLSGTVVGALYAYIAFTICRTNPYALVFMASLPELFISYIVTQTTFPSLGVVASVTLPPILFLPYFQPQLSTPTAMLAVIRSAMIAAGIVAALIMNSLVFPRHCRVLYLNSACRTLGLFSQLYMGLSRDLFHHAQTSSILVKRNALKLELSIRQALHRMTILVKTMDDELSLIPKPMQRYRETITVLQQLLDLLTGIRKIRENIPRKETVEDVIPQRREFVSCVCVSFFACEQVFRARQPLPQFLPSARVALRTLEKDVGERIRQSRRQEGAASLGLSVIYAYAEIDVLRDLVDTIDDLLELSRQLFGSSKWFEHPSSETSTMIGLHEEAGTRG